MEFRISHVDLGILESWRVIKADQDRVDHQDLLGHHHQPLQGWITKPTLVSASDLKIISEQLDNLRERTIMAAALQSFRFAVRSCKCRSIPRRQITRPIGRGREFSTTHLRWKDPVFLDEDDEEGELEERLLNLAFEDGEEAFENAKKSLLEAQELSEDIESDLKETIEEGHIEAWEKREPRNKKLKQTFMNMGEDEPWEEEGMLPDDDDDMTALGHLELEQHREMREYARLAAWDMPLLSRRWTSRGGFMDSRRVTNRRWQKWSSHFNLPLWICV